MIIEPRDFDNGAIFYIKASNDTEFVLLTACVDGKVLDVGDKEMEFNLTLKVSNA